jgi:hypothetical protein
MTIDAIEKNRADLFSQYEKLDPGERLLLQVLAVADEPLSNDMVCLLCSQVRLAGAAVDDSPATSTGYLPVLRRLRRSALIAGNNQINPLLVDVLVRSVFADTTTKVVLHKVKSPAETKKRVPSRRGSPTRSPKALALPETMGLARGITETVRTILPASKPLPALKGNQLITACRRTLRELRLSVVGGGETPIAELVRPLMSYCLSSPLATDEQVVVDPVAHMANNPFDSEWMTSLPPERRAIILTHIFTHTFYQLEQDHQALHLALDPQLRSALPDNIQDAFRFHLLLRLLLGGKLAQAREIAEEMRRADANQYDEGFSAWITLLTDQPQQALSLFEAVLKRARRRYGKRTIFLPSLAGPFFLLALIRRGDVASLNQASIYLDQAQRQWQERSTMATMYAALEAMLANLNGTPSAAACRPLLRRFDDLRTIDGPLAPWFVAMALYSINGTLKRAEIQALNHLFNRCRQAGLDWPALECAQLLCMADKETPERRRFITTVTETSGIVPLCAAIVVEESWRRGLRALQRAAEADGSPTTADTPASRIVYLLDFSRSGTLSAILPLEQKLGAKGCWTKGRPIALQRLLSGEKLDGLTEADQGLRAAIRRQDHYYGNHSYEFNLRQALPALVGHPRLFLADAPTIAVEVVKGSPEILVVEQNGKMCIRFTPQHTGEDTHVLVRETATRYSLVELTAAHHRMAQILGSKGLTLPTSAKEEMSSVLSSLAALVPVHSTIPGTAHSISTVPADARPRAHLLPHGEGVRLEFFVKPLGQSGPALKPGLGVPNLMADVEGRRCHAERDLRQEQQRTATLMRSLPSLATLPELDGQWFAAEVEEALQLLLELREAQVRDEVVVEWPEGEKLKIGNTLSFGDMHLRLGSGESWFEVDGELRVDDDRILEMRQLLDLLSTTQHRFLPLGDGEFLALSRELRKRLDELAAYAQRKGKKLHLHPLAALAMEEFTDQVGTLDGSAQWRQRLETVRAGMALSPQPPSTFKAKLRDYQVEGFQWLARLAHLGFGACLADDMGLGKTIQALATILHSADKGPTLVVAPTSVCGNWLIEARRFTPTLRLIPFGGNDRAGLLAELGPFDLVIASYGLLYQEAELLSAIEWQTVVLDEAQAIKNAATKRSQAAMHLKAHFKLATTGTPIENHLSEFWTLFNFINPGLLGSRDKFNSRFAVPIERLHDREASRRLKKLVRPFILRRLKSQVLEELPPRTEVTLEVELSTEERAFYEALRRQALERIEAEKGSNGGTPMRILAEITRLRQACCHPRLLAPDTGLIGAKLNLFGEVVSELLENGHKALVFSQFVGHLNLIREYLDGRTIDYRYLDGSTPAKQRQQEVDAFQSGQGDLFLISLKAGGLGLNLTAADYVIHMDPWWNPAVEDQASDRAHRMGQERPVTVYRLVAKDTIEEKIVRLHAEKRDLADSLLEETDSGASLSADDLLQLIREG